MDDFERFMRGIVVLFWRFRNVTVPATGIGALLFGLGHDVAALWLPGLAVLLAFLAITGVRVMASKVDMTLALWHRTYWAACVAFVPLCAALAVLIDPEMSLAELNGAAIKANIHQLLWYVGVPLGLCIAGEGALRAYTMAREHPAFREFMHTGPGGSARWAGEETYRQRNKAAGQFDTYQGRLGVVESGWLFLGRSKPRFDKEPREVGILDDAHMLTFGMTGAGKSVYALFNIIPSYPGSLFCLNPKLELSDYGMRRRLEIGQNAHSLDPFGYSKAGVPSSRYNPLADIDLESSQATNILQAISAGAVLGGPNDKPHFVETCELTIQAAIVHVLSTRPKRNHNLPFVHDLLIGLGDGESDAPTTREAFQALIHEMAGNPALGRIGQKAARMIYDVGKNELGSILSTVQRNLKWVADPSMRHQLSGHDFSLDDLASGNLDVFVGLPFDYMNDRAQNRWMRVLTNIAIAKVQTADTPPKPPVLFLLDEFLSLGYSERIRDAVTQVRGAGIKLWFFVHQVKFLKQLYGEAYDIFLGQSNIQALALGNDIETAKELAARLGGVEESKPLMPAAKIREFLGKGRANQIVIPVDGLPMQLDSVPFTERVSVAHRQPWSPECRRPAAATTSTSAPEMSYEVAKSMCGLTEPFTVQEVESRVAMLRQTAAVSREFAEAVEDARKLLMARAT